MASSNKKQKPGVYQRLNTSTQLHEERHNRASRRAMASRTRRSSRKLNAEWRQARIDRGDLASRVYYS